MSDIGINELVFNKDEENGIYSGGFSVNSIMLKKGISPIITMNNQTGGNINKVSDLFNHLVVPNWLLSQPYKFSGGGTNNSNSFIKENIDNDDSIDDDLHNKLLELACTTLNKRKTQKNKLKTNKKITRKRHLKN